MFPISPTLATAPLISSSLIWSP